MVNINLLPEKVRSAEVLKIVVALGMLSLALPVVFWAWRYTQANAELAAVEKQIDSVNADLNSPQLKQVVAEVEQFSKNAADLDSKRSVVDTLRKKQVVLVRLMDVLPDLIPARACLSHLEVKDAKGVKGATLEGSALSADVLAELYTNLEANPVVKNLKMDSPPSASQANGHSVLTFKLSFEVGDQL
jgi:Tfp pilus assembly protein PilN